MTWRKALVVMAALAATSFPGITVWAEEESDEAEWLTSPDAVYALLEQRDALKEAIHAYIAKFGRPPMSLADLTRVPEGSDEEDPILKKVPSPAAKWHKKKAAATTYKEGIFNSIRISRGGEGVVRLEDLLIKIRDTGGWGYLLGSSEVGQFYVLFLSCSHPSLVHSGRTFSLRELTAVGAYKTSDGWMPFSVSEPVRQAAVAGAKPIDEARNRAMATRERVELAECVKQKGKIRCEEEGREAATRGNLLSLKSAISIYYGDTEGNYPANLLTTPGVPFSKYLAAVPPVVATHAGIGRGTAESPAGNEVLVTTDENITTSGKGWRYNPENGHIFVNSSATDSKGVPYSTYGY